MNKLRNAVRGVLSAWASWSVYNVTFLDELQAKFEGRESPPSPEMKNDSTHDDTEDEPAPENTGAVNPEEVEAPRSRWVEAKDIEEISHSESMMSDNEELDNAAPFSEENSCDGDGETLNEDDLDGDVLAEDIDGEALDDSDLDGEPLTEEEIADLPSEMVGNDENH